jgi:transposase
MPTLIRRANAPAARVRATAERASRQARRLQAAELFTRGMRPAAVARQLGVSKQSASRWHAAWTAGGPEALHSRGPSGLPPRGCRTPTREFGVRHHLGHLWAILHQRMGWSMQRPVRRAVERDEQAIRQWVAQDWPRIKQTVNVGLRSERVAVRVRRRRCGMTPKRTGATVAFGRAVCRGASVDLVHP